MKKILYMVFFLVCVATASAQSAGVLYQNTFQSSEGFIDWQHLKGSQTGAQPTTAYTVASNQGDLDATVGGGNGNWVGVGLNVNLSNIDNTYVVANSIYANPSGIVSINNAFGATFSATLNCQGTGSAPRCDFVLANDTSTIVNGTSASITNYPRNSPNNVYFLCQGTDIALLRSREGGVETTLTSQTGNCTTGSPMDVSMWVTSTNVLLSVNGNMLYNGTHTCTSCASVRPYFSAIVDGSTDFTSTYIEDFVIETIVTPSTTNNLTIYVTDGNTGSFVNPVNVTLFNSSFSVERSGISGYATFPPVNGTFFVNISGAGYVKKQSVITNNQANAQYNESIFQTMVSVDFGNYVTYNQTNFTRALSYNLSVSNCFGSNNTLQRYVNGVLNTSFLFDCDGNNASSFLNQVFNPQGEQVFNVSFKVPEVDYQTSEVITDNYSFQGDLNNPTISLSYAVGDGFFSTAQFNTTLICSDSILNSILSYTLTINNNEVVNANYSNGTVLLFNETLANGANNLYGVCADFFGSTASNITFSAFSKNIVLWDEILNTQFTSLNATDIKIWFGNNATFFDFKAAGVSNVSYTSTNNTKLRVELTYGEELVQRFLDADLISEPTIKVCANRDDITHYEQFIISSSQSPAIMKNTYTECYILGDYTRFAYENAFFVRSFTIDSLYYLYTFDNEEQVLLSSVDGGVQSNINLDTLEFQQNQYELSLLSDALSFQKVSNTTVLISYDNLREDNNEISLNITRLDTNEVVFSSSDFTDPNSFTYYFQYSTLSNVTSTTLFQITVLRSTDDGDYILKRFFNTGAGTGVIRPELAAFIAVALLFFGLTFTAAKFSFSWFGILVGIFALLVLTLAVSSWYTIFLQAITVISVIFIGLIMNKTNQGSIA